MEFNRNKYRIYDWKHFMMVHWMLNPALAFNELVLGQRIPNVILEDKTSNKPRYARTYVLCPHCEALHDGRTWSIPNNTGFKNWFGMYCPSCGGIIPCLSNFTSLLILAVTFPIWGWFRKALKAQWLAKQPERFRNIDINIFPDPFANKGWIFFGMMFGVFMFLIMEIVMPLILDEAITGFKLIIGIPIWLASGLCWGYFMKLFSGKRGKDYNGFIGRRP